MNVKRFSNERVLVIDTSTDYIDYIYRMYPGRAVFVTDPTERLLGKVKAPDAKSELLIAMDNAPWRQSEHLDDHSQGISGPEELHSANGDCKQDLRNGMRTGHLHLDYSMGLPREEPLGTFGGVQTRCRPSLHCDRCRNYGNGHYLKGRLFPFRKFHAMTSIGRSIKA
jgi:hypothetical protein